MYDNLWLIWLRDPEMFGRYQVAAAFVAARYGRLARSFTPLEVYGEGMALPDIVNLTLSPERHSLAAMNADPEFRAVVSLRTDSTDLARVGGVDEPESVDDTGLAERRYLIEMARFGAGGAVAYREYERAAGALMTPYGYHVERVFRPAGDVDGLPFSPDLVKVAYFDTDAAFDRFHADPGHAEIEGPRYAAAVTEALWLVARAHNATHGDECSASVSSPGSPSCPSGSCATTTRSGCFSRRTPTRSTGTGTTPPNSSPTSTALSR
jgi:hypothetical protein